MRTHIPQAETPRVWRVRRTFVGNRRAEEVVRALIAAHQG